MNLKLHFDLLEICAEEKHIKQCGTRTRTIDDDLGELHMVKFDFFKKNKNLLVGYYISNYWKNENFFFEKIEKKWFFNFYHNSLKSSSTVLVLDTLSILTFLIVSVSAHLMHGIDRVANCTVELWQFCGWDATSPEGFGTSYKIWPHFWKHITAKTKQKKSRIILASSLAQPAATAGKHLWHTWNNSISRGVFLRW